MDSAEIQSGPAAGITEVLLQAASAAAGPKHDPVGVLDVNLSKPGAQTLESLEMEASFAYDAARRVVERLDVRLRTELAGPPSGELLQAALERFGGTAFTSLTVFRGSEPGAEELSDITVSLPARPGFVAHNSALFPAVLTQEELAACRQLLECLRVKYRAHPEIHAGRQHTGLRVSSWQVRARPKPSAQRDGFLRGFRHAGHAVLYTATLPLAHSLRIEQRALDTRSAPGAASSRIAFDMTLSVGLAGGRRIEPADMLAMQQFLEQHFAVRIGSQKWEVTNLAGSRPSALGRGVVRDRKKPQWSVNWGVRWR
ncbi:MAG TPA: hypothetical protein VGJ84_07185 [Polyangiaceae bacterium]|jgi:hypothetical protein